MTDVYTSDPAGIGKWIAAAALALALHLLLAWVLLGPEPRPGQAPADGGAGLRVAGVHAGAGQPGVLADAAARLPVLTDAAPMSLQPVEPPEARAMVEPAPAASTRSPARPDRSEPAPRARANGRGAPKPAPRGGSETSLPPRALAGSGSPKAGESGTRKGARSGAGNSRSANSAGRGADRAAAPLKGNPRPAYPTLARSHGHEGRVLIQVSVLGDGRVGSARVASSSGHGSLDRAALKAVKRWRFRPALRGGKPVTATLMVPVVFRLEG